MNQHSRSLLIGTLLLCAAPASAAPPLLAQAPIEAPSTSLRFVPRDAPTPAPATDDEQAPIERSAGPPAFGAAGSLRWHLVGGGGVSTGDESFGLFGGGISWFFVENFSLDLDLYGVFYDQPGPNAWAVNPTLLLRWHFLARDTWSIYADGGAGIEYASETTPAGGSRFGFTPQIGVGGSFEVATDVRMMVGVRWRHVSNANLYPENEAIDAIMGYVQLSFPF